MKRPGLIVRVLDAMLRNFGFGVWRVDEIVRLVSENGELVKQNNMWIENGAVAATKAYRK